MRALNETQFWHFCQNERDFEHRDEPIDFPIRDPLAVSVSWRSFQRDREDMDEFRRWEAAIAFLKDRPHTVHRIEDLPKLEGDSGPFWAKDAIKNRDLDSLKQLPEVRYLLEWIERPDIQAFFKPHYPEGFWWQNTERQNS
jgi:hypothetical protein